MPYAPYILVLILSLYSETLGYLPVPDPRPTIVLMQCTDYPQGGNIIFKAQNSKERLIIRSTHCWEL